MEDLERQLDELTALEALYPDGEVYHACMGWRSRENIPMQHHTYTAKRWNKRGKYGKTARFDTHDNAHGLLSRRKILFVSLASVIPEIACSVSVATLVDAERKYGGHPTAWFISLWSSLNDENCIAVVEGAEDDDPDSRPLIRFKITLQVEGDRGTRACGTNPTLLSHMYTNIISSGFLTYPGTKLVLSVEFPTEYPGSKPCQILPSSDTLPRKASESLLAAIENMLEQGRTLKYFSDVFHYFIFFVLDNSVYTFHFTVA